MQTTVPLPTAEYQRLKGIEKEFDQMKDMPWSDVVPKGFHYIKVNQDMKYSALEIKHEALDLRYNQLRKDNVRLSRDYDECKTHNGKMCDDNITLEKTNSTHLHKIYHLKNEVSAIAKRERKLIAELEEQKLEIEDYKKTIKSFESDKNIKGKNYLVWYLFVAFALLFGLIVFAAEYIVFK